MPLPNNPRPSEIELVQVFLIEQVLNIRKAFKSLNVTFSRLKEAIQPVK